MPYKASGSSVLVFRNGQWVLFKRHDSPIEALRQARALNAAMDEDEYSRRKSAAN